MSRSGQLRFVGVTTGGSRIMALFPRWAEALGLDADIAGRDVEIGAPPDAYRKVVAEIAEDEAALGALVTTHKVQVLRHAGDLFARLDPYAELLGEVSCIAARDGSLEGYSKDPVTSGRSVDEMIPRDHWTTHDGAQALCLGAGGAGAAIGVMLATRDPAPARVVLTDTDAGRVDEVRAMFGRMDDLHCAVDAVHVDDAAASDDLVERLPAGSLVVNATGMGKDVPGSPVSDDAAFPRHGVVWELNYRGARPFLAAAHAQAQARSLQVHDGWRYFLHGWAAVISEVYDVAIGRDRFEQLARVAEPHRPE